MHPTRPWIRLVAGALLPALAIGVTACGDDEDADGAAPPTSEAGADTTDPGGEDGGEDGDGAAPIPDGTTLDDLDDVAATEGFGQGTLDITAAFGAAPEDPAEAGPFITDQLLPVVESMDDGLQGGLVPVLAAYEALVRDAGETGDFETIFGPDATTVRDLMGEAAHTVCDFDAVEVTATDYSFGDLASQDLTAGPTSFAMDNEGGEEHEMVIFKADDGVTATAEELLADDPEALFAESAFTGVTFGGPGTRSYAVVELEAGATYYFICSIPVDGAEDGPPPTSPPVCRPP